MNHQDMRLLLRDAFARVFGRDATLPELQCLQAIAALETSYGQGWKPPGNSSNNYGAIQAGSGWNGETFQYTDTHPNADGSSTPYQVKFRKYATPIDGAIDLTKVVYLNRGRDKTVLAAASRGDTVGFSKALRESGYYEGFGATIEERVRHHHEAVERSIRLQADALHECLPADLASKPRVRQTVKLGSVGLDVQALQAALNASGATPQLVADGSFGAKTAAALKIFQTKRGLVADGVCGPATWAALGVA